jgi:hypothetical protein
MTQTDFASRIGVGHSYLSAAEYRRNEAGGEVVPAISREFDPESPRLRADAVLLKLRKLETSRHTKLLYR